MSVEPETRTHKERCEQALVYGSEEEMKDLYEEAACELRSTLEALYNKACQCDSWICFPYEYLDMASDVLDTYDHIK